VANKPVIRKDTNMERLSRKVFLGVISSFFCSCLLASEIEQTSSYYSMSLDGEMQTGEKFSTSISLEKTVCGKYLSTQRVYGIDRYCPNTLVKDLKIQISNKTVVIPNKAFSDLADVNLPAGLYMTQHGKEARLYLLGGDGVAAYTATFFIRDNRVIARSIEELSQDGELEKTMVKYK